MDRAQAALYLTASSGNPFVAAWLSVLDAHGMPHRTEVAPEDWEDAFEQLFHFDCIRSDDFHAVDFRRAFRRHPPPPRDVEAALARLAELRRLPPAEEDSMTTKLDIFEKTDTLALREKEREGALSRFEGFQPIAPRPSVPAEIMAPPGHAESALAPLAPTRRVFEEPPKRAALAPAAANAHRLPCTLDDDREFPLDPRTYIEEFEPELYCCGQKVELIYDDGREATTEEFAEQFPERILVEFIFHSVCAHCNTEGHHSFVRPLPADLLPR